MIAYLLMFSCLFTTLCSCDLIISRISQMTDMNNLRPVDNSSVVLSTTSVLQCVIECSNSLSCEWLSHHSVKGTCLLHPFLFADAVETIGEDSWESYGERCYTKQGYVFIKPLAWCYRLVNEKLNATMAADFCRLDGARMIRITSVQRHLHVTDLLHSQGVETVWIGGQSLKGDKYFVFEDGTPLYYFHWASDQPIQNIYIRLVPVNNTYAWQNGKGNGLRAFLCEW